MSTVDMVKTIKKIYPGCAILVKVGNFYHVYGKDAYIFSYLFEYKIVEKARSADLWVSNNFNKQNRKYIRKK